MPPERARALSCRGTRTLGRVGQRLRSHVCALHPGSGKGGRPQLSAGREVAHTGTHSGTTQWRMESPEREELGGALPGFRRIDACSSPTIGGRCLVAAAQQKQEKVPTDRAARHTQWEPGGRFPKTIAQILTRWLSVETYDPEQQPASGVMSSMEQRRFYEVRGEESDEWLVLDGKRHPPRVL
jgi:hypothetical protein